MATRTAERNAAFARQDEQRRWNRSNTKLPTVRCWKLVTASWTWRWFAAPACFAEMRSALSRSELSRSLAISSSSPLRRRAEAPAPGLQMDDLDRVPRPAVVRGQVKARDVGSAH